MRKQSVFVMIALAAGFVGGSLSSGLRTVFAQERTTQITAERFVVVDSKGIKRGEFGLDSLGGIQLNLYNENGRLQWSAPARAGLVPLRQGPVGPSQ